MIRIKRRARSALLLAALLVGGVCFYAARFALQGGRWAASYVNRAVYADGRLAVGELTDRNGVVLASPGGTGIVFAEDEKLRRAALHVTGDAAGNIGTGALTAFKSQLIGYDIVNGVYARGGAGGQVALTVDSRLQTAAYDALANRRGCVIVSDYETGDIVCVASSPTFDPAFPPESAELDARYEGVYINRAISSAYIPGSIFKLVTSAAAIENIGDIYSRVFECSGSTDVGGDTVTCTQAHGSLTFEDALAVSCNVTFAQLSLELGADTLARYADEFGLTRRHAIDGIETAKGGFDKGGEGSPELAWSGVGQYNDTVCPAAMLRLVSAIAGDGAAAHLRLVSRGAVSRLIPPATERLMAADTARQLALMMNYNASRTYGASNFPGLELYAKSGTAEVGGGKQPHAWFTGYITNDGCHLAFTAIVENGGSGASAAGAVVNAVLQEALRIY
ncbi:MAG: penicillin-binding protein [Oscillospiraceae bacterium]|jgi:peptidoglycan glycosyltransferase|nr:penicillin-binding protein [Oscillospiraceae bacterium]